MEGTSYLRAAAAVLFAALCAWLGAWLFPSVSEGGTVTAVSPVSAPAMPQLEGIALRHETPLALSRSDTLSVRDGERLSAGAVVCMSAGQVTATSEKSSIFLFGCDGFEYLSPPESNSLSPGELDRLLTGSPDNNAAYQARLVEGFYWYYAAFLRNAACELSPGEYRLKFEGFEQYVSALLLSAERTEDGKCALLFRIRTGDTAFLKLRKCTAELLLPAE